MFYFFNWLFYIINLFNIEFKLAHALNYYYQLR